MISNDLCDEQYKEDSSFSNIQLRSQVSELLTDKKLVKEIKMVEKLVRVIEKLMEVIKKLVEVIESRRRSTWPGRRGWSSSGVAPEL